MSIVDTTFTFPRAIFGELGAAISEPKVCLFISSGHYKKVCSRFEGVGYALADNALLILRSP